MTTDREEGFKMTLINYLGTTVTLKEDVPGNKRGTWVKKNTKLVPVTLHGYYFDLEWPGGGRAANQVHFSKLRTA